MQRDIQQAISNAMSIGAIIDRPIDVLAIPAVCHVRQCGHTNTHDIFEDVRNSIKFKVPFEPNARLKYLKEAFWHLAQGLAAIRRWNGASKIAVAQHCSDGAHITSEASRGYFMIHDGEEMFIGDILSPVKEIFRQSGIWHQIEDELVLPLRKRLTLMAGLQWPWPKAVADEVDLIDKRLQATEFRDAVDRNLVIERCRGFASAEPFDFTLSPLSGAEAARSFYKNCLEVLPSLQTVRHEKAVA